MTPASLLAYRGVTALLEPLAPGLLRGRARRGKEDPARLEERLGRTAAARPPGPLAWLHGASVGESLSLLPLVAALRARRPDLAVLVTSGTVTSAELMKRRLPAGAIHQFVPVDAPGAATRFVDHWRPDLAVFVESELWPNLLGALRERGAPTTLVSARLSDASLKGWARAPAAARALLSGFRLVMAQDEATAARLAALGAADHGRLNLKLAGEPPPVDEERLTHLRAAAAGRPVVLAASTHPGEEEMAVAAAPDHALLVIVPRHPARGPSIAAEGIQSQGARFGATRLYVADALGELGTWFALADSAFIGGSLVPGPEGHNPVEAAKLGVPIITGPHVANWREVYATLGEAVVRVDGAETLAAAWRADLDRPEAAKARAERARVIAAQGAAGLDAAADKLVELLP